MNGRQVDTSPRAKLHAGAAEPKARNSIASRVQRHAARYQSTRQAPRGRCRTEGAQLNREPGAAARCSIPVHAPSSTRVLPNRRRATQSRVGCSGTLPAGCPADERPASRYQSTSQAPRGCCRTEGAQLNRELGAAARCSIPVHAPSSMRALPNRGRATQSRAARGGSPAQKNIDT